MQVWPTFAAAFIPFEPPTRTHDFGPDDVHFQAGVFWATPRPQLALAIDDFNSRLSATRYNFATLDGPQVSLPTPILLSRVPGYQSFNFRLISVQETGSFDFSCDGLGDVVGQVINALDPQARRERKEDLRHAQKMHSLEEMRELISLNEEGLASYMRMSQMLIESAVLTNDEAVQNIRQYLRGKFETTRIVSETLDVEPKAIDTN